MEARTTTKPFYFLFSTFKSFNLHTNKFNLFIYLLLLFSTSKTIVYFLLYFFLDLLIQIFENFSSFISNSTYVYKFSIFLI